MTYSLGDPVLGVEQVASTVLFPVLAKVPLTQVAVTYFPSTFGEQSCHTVLVPVVELVPLTHVAVT